MQAAGLGEGVTYYLPEAVEGAAVDAGSGQFEYAVSSAALANGPMRMADGRIIINAPGYFKQIGIRVAARDKAGGAAAAVVYLRVSDPAAGAGAKP